MLLVSTSLTYEIHFCRKKEKESFFFLYIRGIISLDSSVRGSKKKSFLISAQCIHVILINANKVHIFKKECTQSHDYKYHSESVWLEFIGMNLIQASFKLLNFYV